MSVLEKGEGTVFFRKKVTAAELGQELYFLKDELLDHDLPVGNLLTGLGLSQDYKIKVDVDLSAWLYACFVAMDQAGIPESKASYAIGGFLETFGQSVRMDPARFSSSDRRLVPRAQALASSFAKMVSARGRLSSVAECLVAEGSSDSTGMIKYELDNAKKLRAEEAIGKAVKGLIPRARKAVAKFAIAAG